MKLALTVWGDRISPLCDSARSLLIVGINQEKTIENSRVQQEISGSASLISLLEKHQVDTLICGAISESLSTRMKPLSIQVIPFISGPVATILNAFCREQLHRPKFRMPGFRSGHKKQFRRRLGGGRGRSGNLFNF